LEHSGVFPAFSLWQYSQIWQLIKAVWSMAIPSREAELPLWEEGAAVFSTTEWGRPMDIPF
jgi:hypothetical protein